MGNQATTQKPPLHEDTLRIINANVLQTQHLQKSADAVSILAYVGVVIIIIIIAYALYRVAINYERMKTDQRIRRVVSLSSVLSEK